MPISLLAIALGATLGAWARWGLTLWLNPLHGQLPVGTLTANLIGGYFAGVAVAWFTSYPHLSQEWRLFLVTGLLGSLTTFSTFSAETVLMLHRQDYGWALLAMAAHLGGSLAMTGLGLLSFRLLRPALY